jgi:hypothetical protein
MSLKPEGRLGTRASRRLEFFAIVFIAAPMLALLISLLLMPLFAAFAAVAYLGDVLGPFVGILAVILILIFNNLWLTVEVACVLLSGDFSQFVRLLPELLTWLRSLALL